MSREDSEIAEYFADLVDHGRECQSADCQTCAALSGMMETIRERLFATAMYAAAVPPPRSRPSGAGPSTTRQAHSVR